MRDISLFDVIGPNMIGPSSSHTAGALRIASLSKRMVNEDIKEVEFILYGSFSKTYRGHGTDRALLSGIMGFSTEDERISNAYEEANNRNIVYKFITNDVEKNVHPNTVRINLSTNSGEKMTVVGESIGGGSVQITEIDSVKLMFTGEYSTLIISNIDNPGVIFYVTKCLNDLGINIAFMRTYREEKGKKAYTIIEADEKINSDIIPLILKNEDIIYAKIIEM